MSLNQKNTIKIKKKNYLIELNSLIIEIHLS